MLGVNLKKYVGTPELEHLDQPRASTEATEAWLLDMGGHIGQLFGCPCLSSLGVGCSDGDQDGGHGHGHGHGLGEVKRRDCPTG